MKPKPVGIRTGTIGLAQFLKFAGIAATGGEASALIRQGEVRVNGALETRRGRSLSKGDVVSLGEHSFIVEVEQAADSQTPDTDQLP